MRTGRVIELGVFAALVLLLGAFVLADRRALGQQMAEVRAQAKANEKRVDEAHNNIRFLTLRVEDLEGDVELIADHVEHHTHPGARQKAPSLILKLREKIAK